MFRDLHIRDLALIAEVRLSLHRGFVVWSGETGAGKSLLLSAIGLLTGDKADSSMVRSGAAEAVIRGSFDLSRPDIRNHVDSILGEVVDDDSLIIVRRIQAEGGRSSATVNGSPVPIRTLQALGRLLVDRVGQHQTRSLSDPARQTALLDQFGGVHATFFQFQEARKRYESMRRKREETVAATAQDEIERDRLRVELEELDQLDPIADEPPRLIAEAKRLSRADEIRRVTSLAHGALVEVDGSISDQIAKVVKKLSPVASLSKPLNEVYEQLTNLIEELDEIAAVLNEVGESSEADPNRSEAIERRLADYRRLARRYSASETDLPVIRETYRTRLSELEKKFRKGIDNEELSESWNDCLRIAQSVTTSRQAAASRLSAAINEKLSRLAMETAEISIQAESIDWPAFGPSFPHCPDDPAPVRVLFRPNPGEPHRTLEKIASGGELSRLLLAALACLADSDSTPTVILDEIDSGVGGRLGAEIGSAIAELSSHHQVLCITHLPQIAAQADQHFLVRKRRETGRTVTTVEELDSRERRIDELAAMLRGSRADSNTRVEAEAMLTLGEINPAPHNPDSNGSVRISHRDRSALKKSTSKPSMVNRKVGGKG